MTRRSLIKTLLISPVLGFFKPKLRGRRVNSLMVDEGNFRLQKTGLYCRMIEGPIYIDPRVDLSKITF